MCLEKDVAGRCCCRFHQLSVRIPALPLISCQRQQRKLELGRTEKTIKQGSTPGRRTQGKPPICWARLLSASLPALVGSRTEDGIPKVPTVYPIWHVEPRQPPLKYTTGQSDESQNRLRSLNFNRERLARIPASPLLRVGSLRWAAPRTRRTFWSGPSKSSSSAVRWQVACGPWGMKASARNRGLEAGRSLTPRVSWT